MHASTIRNLTGMRFIPVEQLCIPKIMNVQRPGILEYLSLNRQIKDKAVQRVCVTATETSIH